MTDPDSIELRAVAKRLREQAVQELVRLTIHAHQEMVEESIVIEEVLEAIASCRVLENYPEHRRGSCCLVCGYTRTRRALHVVCTTAQPLLVVITVYEPKLPKWATPTERGKP